MCVCNIRVWVYVLVVELREIRRGNVVRVLSGRIPLVDVLYVEEIVVVALCGARYKFVGK